MPDARIEPGPPTQAGTDAQDYGPPSRWDFRPPHPVGHGEIVEMPAQVQGTG